MVTEGEEVMENWVIIQDHPEAPGCTAPQLIGKCFDMPSPKRDAGRLIFENLGRLVFVNGRVCEAYGYRPKRKGE